MTFAQVGSYIDLSGIGQGTFTLNPAGVGDLILVEILVNDTTVTCTGLSGGNCTWQIMVPAVSVGSGVDHRNGTVFAGKSTATGAATATPTYSGTPTGVTRGGAREWSSTIGNWILDVTGLWNSTGAGAPLTPLRAGELYAAYLHDAGTATAGTTTGYTYDPDLIGNMFVSNPACTSAAQAPNIGDTNVHTGITVLVREVGPAAGPVLLRGPAAARPGKLAQARGLVTIPPSFPAPFFPPHYPLRPAPAAAQTGHLTRAAGPPGHPSLFAVPRFPLRGPAAARPGKLAQARGLVTIPPSFPAPFFAPHSPVKGRAAASRSVLASGRGLVTVPPPFVPQGQPLPAPDDKPYLKKLFYLL